MLSGLASSFVVRVLWIFDMSYFSTNMDIHFPLCTYMIFLKDIVQTNYNQCCWQPTACMGLYKTKQGETRQSTASRCISQTRHKIRRKPDQSFSLQMLYDTDYGTCFIFKGAEPINSIIDDKSVLCIYTNKSSGNAGSLYLPLAYIHYLLYYVLFICLGRTVIWNAADVCRSNKP